MNGEYKKNCYFCHNLGSDGGDEYSGYGAYPTCEVMPGRDNLKSFPFKKEQKCHVPDFWKVMDIDKEISDVFHNSTDTDYDLGNVDDWESWKLFKKKYLKEEA